MVSMKLPEHLDPPSCQESVLYFHDGVLKLASTRLAKRCDRHHSEEPLPVL